MPHQLYNLSALHQFTSGLAAKAANDAQFPEDATDADTQPSDSASGGGGGAGRVPERFAFPVAMLCIRAAARLSSQVSHEARARRREPAYVLPDSPKGTFFLPPPHLLPEGMQQWANMTPYQWLWTKGDEVHYRKSYSFPPGKAGRQIAGTRS